MSAGGGGGTTTVQSNQPPAQFLQAYQETYDRAKQVAGQPYQAYPGNTIAPFSPDQAAAFGAIENAQGIAVPYIDTAADYLNSATAPLLPTAQPYIDQARGIYGGAGASLTGTAQPLLDQARGIYGGAGAPLALDAFTPEAISKYESPYTDDVVRATARLFDEQNAQQANQLRGNAISSGAFGGDREGVAQGILAGQQQLAQAPVLAGLRNTGYQQALQEFNTQQATRLQADQAARQLGLSGASGLAGLGQTALGAEQAARQLGLSGAQGIAGLGQTALGAEQANRWLASQAGYGYAGLGNQAQNSALTGANALLGIGGLQQQQAQGILNAPYQQWQGALAYPFQTTGWLSNIAQGLGSASGGTSSTTTPGPSVGSQVLGAGLAGAGILKDTGAFGSNGWLSGLFGNGGGGIGSSLIGAGVDPGIVDFASGATGGLFGFASGGGVPHMGSGGIAVPYGFDLPDLSVSVVPVGQVSGGTPYLKRDWGSTSTTQGPDTSGQDAMKAIGTIASIAGLVFSDRRLKEDVTQIGALKDGTPIHRFRYKGRPEWHIGVIAQDVERKNPGAVHEMGGIKLVDPKAATDESARAHGGGIAGNDNDPWTPRRATGTDGIAALAGGGSPNDVVFVPGKYASAPAIPHLSMRPLDFGPTDGGIAPPEAGALAGAAQINHPAVQTYLTNVLRGARFGAPQVYQPPPPPAPAPVADAGANSNPNFWDPFFAGLEAGGEGGGGGGGGGGSAGEAKRGGTVRRRQDGGAAGSDDETDIMAGPYGTTADPVPAVDTTALPSYAGAPSGIANEFAPEETAPRSGEGGISPLTYAGLGILSGASPYPGVNIGRGALAGIQAYNADRLARERVAENAMYRRALIGERTRRDTALQDYRGQRLQQIDTANTQRDRVLDLRAQIADRAASLKAAGMDDRRANAQARLDIMRANSATSQMRAEGALANQGARLGQADRAADQRDRAIDLRTQQIAQSKEAATERNRLTQAGHEGRDANAIIAEASRMVAAGAAKLKDFPQIVDRLRQERQRIQPAAPAAAPAAPAAAPAARGAQGANSAADLPDGTVVVQNGVRYRKENGQFVPVQ